MKVVIKRTPQKPGRAYPYLGIDDAELCVLFHGREAGTVLYDGCEFHAVGYRSESWSESMFTPLEGEITLSND